MSDLSDLPGAPYKRGQMVTVIMPNIRPWTGPVMACKPVRIEPKKPEVSWWITVGRDIDPKTGAYYEVIINEAGVIPARPDRVRS